MRSLTFFSYRGGVGKTTLISNLAMTLARRGKKVGVVDFDLVSPGLGIIFGANGDAGLQEVLQGRSEPTTIVIDLTPKDHNYGGGLYLIPSSLKEDSIFNILKGGYTALRVNSAIREVADALSLDYIIMDTHPGFDEDTLIALALSDFVILTLRADLQDYTGTKIGVEVVRRLKKMAALLVNMVPSNRLKDGTLGELEEIMKTPILGVVPFYEDVLASMSREVFTMKKQDHPFSKTVGEICDKVVEFVEH